MMNTEDFMITISEIQKKVENTSMTLCKGLSQAYQLGKTVCFKGCDKGQLCRAFHVMYAGSIGSVILPENAQALKGLADVVKASSWVNSFVKLSEIKGALKSCSGNEYSLLLYYYNLESAAAFKGAKRICETGDANSMLEFCSLLQAFCTGAAE